MTASKSSPLDPKELVPAAFGFLLGLAIITFFVLLAKSLNLPLLADLHALPRQ